MFSSSPPFAGCLKLMRGWTQYFFFTARGTVIIAILLLMTLLLTTLRKLNQKKNLRLCQTEKNNLKVYQIDVVTWDNTSFKNRALKIIFYYLVFHLYLNYVQVLFVRKIPYFSLSVGILQMIYPLILRW